MKNILDINIEDSFVSECWTFYKSCIIGSYSDGRKWMSTHMEVYLDGGCGSFWGNGVYYPLDYYDDILKIAPADINKITPQKLVSYLKHKIDSNTYIVIDCDYSIIFNDKESGAQLHEILIFGYDDEDKVFFCPALGRNVIKIPFAWMEASYDEIRNIYLNDPKHRYNRRTEYFFPITEIKKRKLSMSKDEFLFSCSRRIREELKAEKSTIERIDPEQPRGDPRYVFRGLSILKYYNDFLRLSDNMELVDIYADEGITGTSINKRDDFNRMLRDSSLGKIDRIFVKSVSRFARNSLECIESIRVLKSYGTTVLFENDAIDTDTMNSEMILYIKSAFAQSESLSGSKRVSTAIRMKMSTGEFYNYTAPFGYKAEDKTLIPIPEEAEIVKRIYNEYIAGKGIGKIVSDLNRDGVIGKPWGKERVRYILTNEKYCGDSLYQKSYTPPVLPLRNIPNRGEVDKYYVENTHQAIIDKTVFQTVSKMFEKNMLRYGNRQKRASENFSGRINCGDCGWAYKKKSGNGDPKWVCTKDGIAGQRCNTHPISEAVLKRAFVMMFNRLQQHKDMIIKDTHRKLLILRKAFFNNSTAVEDIDKELAELAEQNSMYVRFHSQTIIDEITFMEQTNEIKRRISELRSRRIKLMNENEEERCIELLRKTEEQLDEFPQAILCFDFCLFDKLIKRIIVLSDALVFEFRCGIKLRETI